MFLLLSFVLITVACLQSGIATKVSCTRCDDEDVCSDGVCLRRCLNRTSSGDCLKCRHFRLQGKHCDCPQQCLNSRCHLNNAKIVCTDGCVSGKRGDNCMVDCPAACTQCGRYDFKCIGPCSRPFFYGDTCEMRCPFYCQSRCDKTTGTCESCKFGHIGIYCNIICTANCLSTCDSNTGVCDSCKSGYRGIYCNMTCPDNCLRGCNRNTGVCESCKHGHRGIYCNLTCPTNCASGCDIVTWKCHSCESGYWGSYCNKTCSKDCTVCVQESGKCLKCVDGRKGEHCDENCDPSCVSCLQHEDLCTGPCRNEQCASTCIKERDGKCTMCRDFRFFGTICDKPCSSNCEGRCEKETGICGSCKPGYRGLQCNQQCPKHCAACEQIGDDCDDNLFPTVKLVCGIAATIVLILSTCMVASLKRRRYRYRERLKTQEIQQRHGQRDSSNMSYPSDRGTYYSSKYWEIDDNDLDPNSCSNDAINGQGASLPCQNNSLGQRCSWNRFGNVLSDEQFILKNKLYSSAQVCFNCPPSVNTAVEAVVWSCDSDERESCARETRQNVLTDHARDEETGSSDGKGGHRLSTKSQQTFFLEENKDFHNIKVKYITPGVSDEN